MNSKADMSINLIIKIIIGLVILAVIISLITGRVSFFNATIGATSCEDNEGVCATPVTGGYPVCDNIGFSKKVRLTGCPFYKSDGEIDNDERFGQCCVKR